MSLPKHVERRISATTAVAAALEALNAWKRATATRRGMRPDRERAKAHRDAVKARKAALALLDLVRPPGLFRTRR